MLRNKPKVSILMPVFNAAIFLNDTLESILAQEYEDWELLAVDDFSSDQSLLILNQFAQKDERINVFSNVSKGIIPALNLAFSQAKGQFITRMDADDLMPINKLEVLVRELQTKGRRNIVCGKVSYFSYGLLGEGYVKYQNWLNEINQENNYYGNIYKECVIPSACWMAYKEDLASIKAFTNSQYPEDYDLVFRFYRAGFSIQGIHEVLHYWRDHSDRTSRIDPKYADQNFFALKVQYFLEIDYCQNKQLYLWGAGKKGKKLAQLLNQNKIPFQWLSDNPNKIGREIYGHFLQSSISLTKVEPRQIIVSIADQNFLNEKEDLFRVYCIKEGSLYEM